ncbi:hypothetical protein LTR97_006447 [Elasticomyces elasticus]|uniref:Uncharacterized protein n=1 Tax=Elasticomyces elasticus TaxID=574655 RepID=A0AAN7ZN78_9PEZI|nr:hypothetical protein LTR97_006447 [Elasticomyces elasticus]
MDQTAFGPDSRNDHNGQAAQLSPTLHQDESPTELLELYSEDNAVDTSGNTSLNAYLADLNRSLLHELCNLKSTDHPIVKSHISRSFVVRQDCKLSRQTFQLIDWISAANMLPDLRAEIISCTVKVERDRRKAKVWTTKRLCGLKDGLCREAVYAWNWHKRAAGWQCVELRTLVSMV